MSTDVSTDVFALVQEVLTEALGLDEDEVVSDATLVGDLGAESIDFLDILFRLEKASGVKITKEEVFPDGLMAHDDYVENGLVTETGLAALREKLPHADIDTFANDPKASNIQDLFTVGLLVRFMDDKINATA